VLRNTCTAGANCKYSHDREALAAGKISGPPAPPLTGAAVAPNATPAHAAAPPAAPAMTVRSSAPQVIQPLVIALSESSEDGEASG
jgi:hypothetical protein